MGPLTCQSYLDVFELLFNPNNLLTGVMYPLIRFYYLLLRTC